MMAYFGLHLCRFSFGDSCFTLHSMHGKKLVFLCCTFSNPSLRFSLTVCARNHNGFTGMVWLEVLESPSESFAPSLGNSIFCSCSCSFPARRAHLCCLCALSSSKHPFLPTTAIAISPGDTFCHGLQCGANI